MSTRVTLVFLLSLSFATSAACDDEPADQTPQLDASDLADTSDEDSTDRDADAAPDPDVEPEDADADPFDVVDADADSVSVEDAPSDSDAADSTADLVFDVAAVVPPLTCSLLANPGAETGDLTGWTVEAGDFAAAQVDPGRLPAPFEGEWFFFGGSAELSRISQTVSLADWAAEIDSGELWLTFGGQARSWAGNDTVSFAITASNALDQILHTANSAAHSDRFWRDRQAALQLPAGTRSVRLEVVAQRNDGTDNDGYADALVACLGAEPPAALDDVTIAPYLMWVTEDAVSVLWETAEPVVGRVEYRRTPGLLVRVAEEESPGTFHEIRLTGLRPDTPYSYRAAWDGGHWLERTFTTAPSEPQPTSFVAWADNQNGPEVFGPLVRRMAATHPRFAVSAGDTVQDGIAENYQNQLLGPIGPLASRVPFLISPGNHERSGDLWAELFDHYAAQPGDEHCFGWRYGDVYFVFIDSMLSVAPGTAQRDCLVELLESADFDDTRFQIAIFHHPPRIEYWAGNCYTGSTMIANYAEPLFESVGVDLVLNGHAHLYAYDPPTDGDQVTWLTIGGGGGHLDGAEDFCTDWPEITFTEHRHHFLHVSVDGDTMAIEAIADDGTTLHSFSILR